MTLANSRVTIHMVASLDGFIAHKDGSVDWLETADTFEDGATMEPEVAGKGQIPKRSRCSSLLW